MITEISKDLAGKVIYGIPTGNNRRRNAQERIVKFKVLAVGRVYMTLLEDGRPESSANKYNANGSTQSAVKSGYGGNAGYMFFDSLANLELHQQANEARTFLRETFGSWGRSFSDTDILEITEFVKARIDD